MERHILILLCFVVSITALKHSKNKREKKGNTEFPCRLPCPWRGKTFDLYDVDGGTSFLNWTVDASGKSGVFPIGITFECYQITDRFIIFRVGGSDGFFCSAISYDGSRHPVTFTLHDHDIITFENKTDKFSDICEVCSYPSSLRLLFVESGAPRPDDASIPCNVPSDCECCQTCTSCAICETDGRIPKACKNGYKDIFQRKKYNKNKFWTRRYRKRLEMKGKRKKSWLYGME